MPNVGNFPVPAYPKPLAIPPSAFVPRNDTYDWEIIPAYVHNRTILTLTEFNAPVTLPQGARVKKLTLYGYRDDALATMALTLFHNDREGVETIMAAVTADWETGYSSGEDATIADPEIDNETRNYSLRLQLDPNDGVSDVQFTGAIIEWD